MALTTKIKFKKLTSQKISTDKFFPGLTEYVTDKFWGI